MKDSHFVRSLGIHAVAAALLAGGVMLRPPAAAPKPEPPCCVQLTDPEPPPLPAPHREEPLQAAKPPPPTPSAEAAPPPAPSQAPAPAEQKASRRELERQGEAFFASGGTYEDLPLRWNRMEPSQSRFLYTTQAGLWVYSEQSHCYVAKARMTASLRLEVTPIKNCSESPAHAVGGRIQAKNQPFAEALAQLESSTGDSTLVFFSDHRNEIRRYIAGVVMSALQSRARKLEDVGQVLLEGAVNGDEPVVRVVSLCDREDNCS